MLRLVTNVTIKNSDYQLGRSIVAFARGEWFGVGYGESIQKLSHLPEAHTDFLLAITGEELGLVGVSFLLVLQIILVTTIMRISYQALARHQTRLSYFAFGVGILFFGQIFVNANCDLADSHYFLSHQTDLKTRLPVLVGNLPP